MIILIALLIPLIVTTAYSMVESYCVHNGKDMPIQHDVYGGECREEVGIFWSIFYLEPMTSMDDPTPATPPSITFSIVQFLKINVGCAFLLWVAISLINRYFKPVIIVVGILVTGFLAVFGFKKGKKAWGDIPVELESVTIITSDVHPGIYNSMFYPHEACYLVPAGEGVQYGYLEMEYMGRGQYRDPASIKGKELRAIINKAKKIKENTDTDWDKEFVYKVYVVYKTKSGYESVKTTGYGDFPEGWGDFVRLVNETCGLNYLREDPEAVSLSPEWFSETFGIHDSDLPGDMTVKEYLEKRKITIKNCSGMNASGNIFSFQPGKALENMQDPYF